MNLARSPAIQKMISMMLRTLAVMARLRLSCATSYMWIVSSASFALRKARKPKMNPKQNKPTILRINAVLASPATAAAFAASTLGGYIGLPGVGGGGGGTNGSLFGGCCSDTTPSPSLVIGGIAKDENYYSLS